MKVGDFIRFNNILKSSGGKQEISDFNDINMPNELIIHGSTVIDKEKYNKTGFKIMFIQGDYYTIRCNTLDGIDGEELITQLAFHKKYLVPVRINWRDVL